MGLDISPEPVRHGQTPARRLRVAEKRMLWHAGRTSSSSAIAKPIKGRKAHAAMIQQMISVFPDIHVHNDPYPIQFGSGGWITVITRATGTFTGEMKLSAVSCFRQS
jgi:hypothetical protein